MALTYILRRKARAVLMPVLGLSFVAYFAYHALHGDRGLLAYIHLQQEIKKAEITRDLVHAERETLDRRVALLRPNSVDPDMLDERARTVLNMGHKDDVVILLQRPQAVIAATAKP
jgi:cell division protein FtsB